MVLTLMIVARKIYGMKDIMTDDHMEKMNIVILVTGSMVGFAYMMEFFIAWYSGVEYEQAIFILRATGPYAWAYWAMMTCNVLSLSSSGLRNYAEVSVSPSLSLLW